MVVGLTGDVDDRAAAAVMASMEQRVRDFRPVWDGVVDDFIALERQQFATSGSLTGGWDPLTPEYAAWKAVHYPGKPIMRRTDALWSSLTNAGSVVLDESGQTLRMGTRVSYAEVASKRRPVVPPIPPETVRQWTRVLRRWVVEGRA